MDSDLDAEDVDNSVEEEADASADLEVVQRKQGKKRDPNTPRDLLNQTEPYFGDEIRRIKNTAVGPARQGNKWERLSFTLAIAQFWQPLDAQAAKTYAQHFS